MFNQIYYQRGIDYIIIENLLGSKDHFFCNNVGMDLNEDLILNDGLKESFL